MSCKLFIGCVSQNVIDATIEYANENEILLGLIPSRRQVDYDGGYVGFTSRGLHEYVKGKGKYVLLERDHGGPLQGKTIDDGIVSLIDDCNYYDILHIDPWKKCFTFGDGLEETAKLIQICLDNNFKGKFEIATEQSIRSFSLREIDTLLSYFAKYCPLEYVVIQSGTSLKENHNTGVYDEDKLIAFTNLVRQYELKSKEHNGDYLPTTLIKKKFKNGLDAINIAPEFGNLESLHYIESIKKYDLSLLDTFYDICYQSNQWKKWVGSNFDVADKEKLIGICGHYVLELEEFKKKVKGKLPDLSEEIKRIIKKRVDEII
jgi:hypothetical protein